MMAGVGNKIGLTVAVESMVVIGEIDGIIKTIFHKS